VLDLHPLPSHVHAGTLVHRIEDASEVASWVDATAPLLPTEVELTLFLARAEDGDGAVCIVAATAFASTPDEARRMLAFVDASPARPRALVAEPVSPTGFDALFANVARFFPEGSRYLGDTAWLAGGLASAIDLLCARLAAAPPGRCFFLCAIRPVLPSGAGGCAVAPLGTVLVNCYAGWDDPAQDAAHVAWHDATMGALAPLTAGHYVGESDVVAHPSRAMRSYPAASWQRLAALRERFDPDRLFHDWSG
jgi:FAD/FMN-containing dehydrogenase